MSRKKVVVIGGGTGTFVVLSGIKKYNWNISVIVTMMDSGGSTGRLIDQYGVLPPGDFRQCLVALSEAPSLWRKLFLYRFDRGDLKGHNFGNIFITALEKLLNDYQKVVDTASFILDTRGNVTPVTFMPTTLCAKYEDGEVIRSEKNIDVAFHKKNRIVEMFLDPQVKANPLAIKQIENAQYIIIGPGDIYTSIVPNLIVSGIKKAIMRSKAKIIYICNLMTKQGQTHGYTAQDHKEDIERYIGKKISHMVMNTENIPPEIIAAYEKEEEFPVRDDVVSKRNFKVHRLPLLSKKAYTKSTGDALSRSLLRHDPKKVASLLKSIIT